MEDLNVNRGDISEINRYMSHLIKCDREPASKTYRSVLYTFAQWLSERDRTFETFVITDIEEYISGIPNANTSNSFLGAMKGYMKFRCGTLPHKSPDIMSETHRMNQMALVKSKPKRAMREKTTLSPDELVSLLETIEGSRTKKIREVFYAGTVLCFYFGARPLEQEHYMRTSGVKHPAVINWNTCDMTLWTTKVKFTRFLPYHEKITPYMKTWTKALPFTTPGEFLTTHLHLYEVGGIRPTARTGRKTVETQMRLAHVDDFITDCVLGHVSRGSSIGDVYTDFEKFRGAIRDVMTNDHYMITNDII